MTISPVVPLKPRDQLESRATGRAESYFAEDYRSLESQISDVIADSRVLVIGGAGSIGTSVLSALVDFGPAHVCVVDQDENGLAEIVRDLRSRPDGLDVREFHTLPIDYGSPIFHAFLRAQDPFDIVLHFAAIKHVRSEKDVYCLGQMISTNVVKFSAMLSVLSEIDWNGRFFCVSTDKAANPTSLMGATKRLMESVLFSAEGLFGLRVAAATTRFANVACSNGSLLQSFAVRLEKRQPLAVPDDVRRYFVSHAEASEICLLSAFGVPSGYITVPRLEPAKSLRSLKSIAEEFVRDSGYEPVIFFDESEARQSVETALARGQYPLLVTALDTVGEKSFEEFVGADEELVDFGLQSVAGIEGRPADPDTLAPILSELASLVSRDNNLAAAPLVELIRRAVPTLTHKPSNQHLDHRM